jgi:hypothetical protein
MWFFFDSIGVRQELILFFFALVGLLGLEFLVHKNYYKHGLDDAFIVCTQISLYVGIGVNLDSTLMAYLAMFILGTLFCIRYVNALSILVSCTGLMAFVFFAITEHSIISSALLPFIAFIIAVLLYVLYLKLNSIRPFYFYKIEFQCLKIFSLVLGCFSLNYMVVRELSISLLNIDVQPGEDIPLAFLFYATTFIIPVFYIFYSLYKKERLFLFIGLLALPYSFFTIRYYHQIIPLEIAFVIGGLILFIISCFAIKKIQFNETGITFIPARGSDNVILKNAQALIVSTQMPNAPIPNQGDMPFGGGGFSGGGAGGKF